MRVRQINQSLKNIESIFSKIILGSNYQQHGNCISWRNYRSGILKNLSYPREYQILLDHFQYSFLLKDNSFIQFYYEFDDEDNLISCRLAYYPVPKFSDECIEDFETYSETCNEWLAEFYYEIMLDMLQNERPFFNNSHLRFDYDKNVTSHSKCHLQFGGINDFRLTSKYIVSPFCFFHKIVNDFFESTFDQEFFEKQKFIEYSRHSINNKIHFEDENDIFLIKD
ncbi:DUF2290 domain-containing protein [Acinetobacter pittii]|uniref:DUF2290 domain-containing protein n=1 Tax=Acinetobacter pittii TaxID=48296 RepID=UPI001BCD4BF5|nr:DUF2290 domain-containing protein [Acinetobacter pittii]WVH56635.1 DUF2290 domain-containing protein [Acinetobacter pittii]